MAVTSNVAPKAIESIRVNATTDNDNTLIPAPGVGRRIVVLGYQLRFIGAGAFILKSGAAGTTHLEEVGVVAPGTRLSYPGTHDGQAFVCDDNAALVVNNFPTGDTLGHLTFYVRTT